ncbi:hypothetical protein AVEN_41495-1 [Araneus ventricosus]|uniref:Uncharacterized protein n=1 Tax=Araneus ventricosus TaxID=182803 RepID=A0A4Y2HBU1_ARAVE|nr:hypothetical protein AVEN_41495-1 [Araneus ventricosus]
MPQCLSMAVTFFITFRSTCAGRVDRATFQMMYHMRAQLHRMIGRATICPRLIGYIYYNARHMSGSPRVAGWKTGGNWLLGCVSDCRRLIGCIGYNARQLARVSNQFRHWLRLIAALVCFLVMGWYAKLLK